MNRREISVGFWKLHFWNQDALGIKMSRSLFFQVQPVSLYNLGCVSGETCAEWVLQYFNRCYKSIYTRKCILCRYFLAKDPRASPGLCLGSTHRGWQFFHWCIHTTLSYDNFILKIKNTFPIFGHIMHFCKTNNFPFGGLSKTDVLFCESSLSKMVSIKANKIKNWTPLLKTNFSWLETLSLGPKRSL